MSSEGCKLIYQWDITTHLLEWLKPKILATPNIVKEARILIQCLVGMQDDITTLKDNLAFLFFLFTTKCALAIWSSNRYMLEKDENLCPHKNLQSSVTATLFMTAKNLKQTRYPSGVEWINFLSQTMEYYSALKRNELSSHGKTQRNNKCLSLSERSQSVYRKGYTLYESNSMTF